MMGCREPGSRVWLSRAENPARKLAWTWELVEADGTLVGLHTGRSNGLVREAIESGVIAPLAGYGSIRNEVRYGENSRIDLLLDAAGKPPCWVEVKNVTAAVAGGVGYFPDAVTERGAKHLREMSRLVASGQRAVLCFCVQRGDVAEVRPADHIDPAYGQALRAAMTAGVEVIAWGARVTAEEIALWRSLPVRVSALPV
jgi:sugar fermentation stimulation protein A